MVRRLLPFILFPVLVLSSCKDLFQFNPNEVRLEESEKNLNEKNIQKLQSKAPGEPIKFIVTGDSQRFYEELDAFVDHVNGMDDISFVLLNGDISDFGLNKEFKWVNDRLSRLKVPYISVIGNHDMLANGRLVYNQMYGPENFSFQIGSNKFICLNSNSEEVAFNGSLPNISWLNSQLNDAQEQKNIFVFSHVPPFSAAFDQNLKDAYHASIQNSGKVRLSIHGHQHSFSITRPFGESSIEYLVVGSVQKRNYGLITVTGETYEIKEALY